MLTNYIYCVIISLGREIASKLFTFFGGNYFMKKLLAFILCFSILFCLSACSNSESRVNQNGLTNTQSTKKTQVFSDEEELKKKCAKILDL